MDRVPTKDVVLPTPILPEVAKSFLLDSDMKREVYVDMRLMSKAAGADIWPPYDKVLAAKKKRRPRNVQYTETSVVLDLKDRLEKNDESFMELCETEIGELLRGVPVGGTLEVTCEGKLGFDGSTGQSIFNQKFSLENRDATDSSLLSTCYVPLEYRTTDGKSIFRNPVPQASSFCQPLRMEYRKETKEASNEINKYIDLIID